ncbi:MAG: GNAT family N-acetyltransferase [Acidobacteriota bacterium]
MSTPFLETERLTIRRLVLADAPFVFDLVNDPSWLRFIGDKNVHSVADAERYLEEGSLASYRHHGFGMFLVESKADGSPMGFCGLLQRDDLDIPDLGYALRPHFWGRGYAREAAIAVLDWGRSTLGLDRILAITAPDNEASMRLLESIGFERLPPMRPAGADGSTDAFFAFPA